MSHFTAAPLPIRADLAAALDRGWAQLGETGAWLTGEERVAVVHEARAAWGLRGVPGAQGGAVALRHRRRPRRGDGSARAVGRRHPPGRDRRRAADGKMVRRGPGPGHRGRRVCRARHRGHHRDGDRRLRPGHRVAGAGPAADAARRTAAPPRADRDPRPRLGRHHRAGKRRPGFRGFSTATIPASTSAGRSPCCRARRANSGRS